MVRTKLEDLSVMEDMTRWLSKHKNIKKTNPMGLSEVVKHATVKQV